MVRTDGRVSLHDLIGPQRSRGLRVSIQYVKRNTDEVLQHLNKSVHLIDGISANREQQNP